MTAIIRTSTKLVYHKKRVLIYRSKNVHTDRKTPSHIHVYTAYQTIPVTMRSLVLPQHLGNVMYYRLQRQHAQLICHVDDNDNIEAYGWIQSWLPFRKIFSSLAVDACMLGPYWTAPHLRGKGLYTELLQQSTALCPTSKPIFIYTAPSNIASQRGILRANFEPIGLWDITRWGWQFGKAARVK